MTVALEQVRKEGWRQLRINQIANEVGVSRPTIYAEFGTKEEFAQALLDREMNGVFLEFSSILEIHKQQPQKALTKAFTRLIELGQSTPIVAGLLIEEGSESTDLAIHPIVTEGLQPFIDRCSEILVTWFKEVSPDTPSTQSLDNSDTLARLVLSNVMTPASKPTTTSKKLTQTALKLFPELST